MAPIDGLLILADILQRVPRKAHLLDLGRGAGQDAQEIRRAGLRVIGM